MEDEKLINNKGLHSCMLSVKINQMGGKTKEQETQYLKDYKVLLSMFKNLNNKYKKSTQK